jgi:hypothetical protein
MSVTIHVDVRTAAHIAVLGEIDAEGATAYVEIRDSSDTVLCTLPLTYPSGSVDPANARLTCGFDGRDESAAASGAAHLAYVCDANGKELIKMTCSAGSGPVSNTCVLTSLAIIAGAPVEGVSLTIG